MTKYLDGAKEISPAELSRFETSTFTNHILVDLLLRRQLTHTPHISNDGVRLLMPRNVAICIPIKYNG